MTEPSGADSVVPAVLRALPKPATRVLGGRPPCPPGFQIVQRIGKGGMGDVWKARDLALDRPVAIKFLRPGAGAEERARFRREAEAVSGLTHPGVTAVYAIGEVEDRPYIVMRLVEGRTLSGWPRQDLRSIATILRDAARAVAHAHSRGILHRDVKPSNILVEPATCGDSATWRVFVTDFGLAKRLSQDEASLTATGAAVGTPAYMAPEQVRGEDVDVRSDVYSLGATLYAALAGHGPVDGTNPLQILRRVLEEEVDPLPGPLGAIAGRAMEKDPRRRYPTADALARDLDAWLAGQPVEARPRWLRPRIARALTRSALLAALPLLALLAALMGRGAGSGREAADAVQAAHEFLMARAGGSAGAAERGRSAERALEAALRSDADDPALWLWLGRCRRAAGQDASDCWEDGLRRRPDHAEILFEHRLSRWEEADRRNLPGGAAASEPMTATGLQGALRAYAEGIEALDRSAWEEADVLFGRALEGRAWDARVWALRSRARRLAGDADAAEADALRAAELAPEDASVHLELGLALQSGGRSAGAEQAFARAESLSPGWARAPFERAVLLAVRDPAGAEAAYRRVIEKMPRWAVAWDGLGGTLAAQDRWAEAEVAFTRAVLLEPEWARPYRGRAGVHRARGRTDAQDADERRAAALEIKE